MNLGLDLQKDSSAEDQQRDSQNLSQLLLNYSVQSSVSGCNQKYISLSSGQQLGD